MYPYGSQYVGAAAPGRSQPQHGQQQAQPLQQPLQQQQQQQQPQHELTHRISNLSDITDYATYHSAAAANQQQPIADPSVLPPIAVPAQRAPIRGRESLVSLQSAYDSPYGAGTASTPPTRAPTGVSAISSVSSTPGQHYVDGSRSSYTISNDSASGWPVANTAYDNSNGIAMSPVNTSGGYHAVGGAGRSGSFRSGSGTGLGIGRIFSRRNNRAGTGRGQHATIVEEDGERESIDMTSLVNSAAPMGGSVLGNSRARSYAPVDNNDDDDDDDDAGSIPFDVTGYMGPTTGQDEAFVKNLQEQEASGKLTLGLGAGFGPGTRLRESDLLSPAAASPAATSPMSASRLAPFSPGASLRRSFSKRWATSSVSSPLASPIPPTGASPTGAVTSAAHLGRHGTVKALAQNEANRRGEIVEIIMEEDEDADKDGTGDGGNGRLGGQHHGFTSEVDLSVMSGPGGAPGGVGGGDDDDGIGSGTTSRQTTFPTSKKKVRVFYPQPNWKPFSMRWPYLLSLVLLSAALAVANEMIYRTTLKHPLVEFNKPEDIRPYVYFAIKFAPTIITVTFGVLWQITDFEVKRLEAFYQMSKESGAVADESINVDYVTYFTFFRPFRALYCKHYAVAVSSVASLLAVSLVPTLGAASIVLMPDRAQRIEEDGGQGLKYVTISAVWSRTLTATFGVISALGCVLFWLLQSRRSGLLSDVKGIAGLASMAVVSHILTDFKDMDVATHKDIHHRLRDHRYVLRNSSLAPDDENPVTTKDKERYRDNHLPINPHPLFLRAAGCVPLIAGIVVYAAFLPIMLFTRANVLADHAAWVLTALAVCIKLSWGGLETSVRMMEPYYLLWRRHAPAKTLTLDYTAMPFVWVALQALFNGHLLVFFVGFGTLLTELLTVLVTSLATVEGQGFLGGHKTRTATGTSRPSSQAGSRIGGSSGSRDSVDVDSGQETAASFWVTLGLALFVLGYMSVVATVVFVRRRRPFLPRQPTTIASVLAFIHQSKMLYTFVGTSKMGNAAMRRKLEGIGAQYGLGWFEGRDGQTHCGVDQEELLSSYKPGYDYSRSNQPWVDQPVEWL